MRARGLDALGEIVQAAVFLERIARRDQPPDPVELQPLHREQADGAVRGMRRIEGAAEQADAHAVGMERDERTVGDAARSTGTRRRDSNFMAVASNRVPTHRRQR